MTRRSLWMAMALLGAMSPALLFPALVGSSHAWVAAVMAAVACVCAVGLLRDFGSLRWWVALLSAMVLAGWLRAGSEAGALNHLCGVALGLFAMATVAAWCRTPDRLVLMTLVFLLGGVIALDLGYRSTPDVARGKDLFVEANAPFTKPPPLPMESLHGRVFANRNAVAAAALLILPVGVGAAAAAAPARLPVLQLGIRIASLLSVIWASVIIVIMQSRSVWISAAVLLWLQVRRRMRPWMWWTSSVVAAVMVPAVVTTFWSDHPQVEVATSALHGRVTVWKQGVQAWRGSPWMGIGLDSFRHEIRSPFVNLPEQIDDRPHAHNMFLQTALDVGLVGLLAYLAVLWGVLRRSLGFAGVADAWSRRVGIGAALSLVAVHLYGLTDAVALGTKVGLFQWLSCGLVLAVWRHRAAGDAGDGPASSAECSDGPAA